MGGGAERSQNNSHHTHWPADTSGREGWSLASVNDTPNPVDAQSSGVLWSLVGLEEDSNLVDI